MSNSTDRIIQNLVNQDRSSQEEFFRIHAAYIHGIAIRYIQDYHIKEEVVQDSFVKIFLNISKFDSSKSSLKTWMTSITVNTCLNALRKTHKHIHLQDLTHVKTENSYEANAISIMRTKDLMSIIQSLPYPQRQIFCMYEIDGYNHNEIAEALKIPSATSRSYLSRTKKQLSILINNTKILMLV